MRKLFRDRSYPHDNYPLKAHQESTGIYTRLHIEHKNRHTFFMNENMKLRIIKALTVGPYTDGTASSITALMNRVSPRRDAKFKADYQEAKSVLMDMISAGELQVLNGRILLPEVVRSPNDSVNAKELQ